MKITNLINLQPDSWQTREIGEKEKYKLTTSGVRAMTSLQSLQMLKEFFFMNNFMPIDLTT